MKKHKTLLQWKREIEEDIKFINEKLDELEKKYKYVDLQVETNTSYHFMLGQIRVLENQLQMINDIIEQVDTQLSLSEDFECCQ